MNPEQYNRLRHEGVEAWNHWREENPNEPIDLSGADFGNQDLRGANLRNANLIGFKANADGVDCTGAYFEDPTAVQKREQAKAERINALSHLKKDTQITVYCQKLRKHPYTARGKYQGIEGDSIVLSVEKISQGTPMMTDGYGSTPVYRGGGETYTEQRKIPLDEMTEWKSESVEEALSFLSEERPVMYDRGMDDRMNDEGWR